MVASGRALRAELGTLGPLGSSGLLYSAQLAATSAVRQNSGLFRAELSAVLITHQYARIFRVELVSPTAVYAGPDVSDIEPWDTILLTGQDGSSNPAIRSWRQVSGAPVTLLGSGTSSSYVAPPSILAQDLTFEYTVDGVTDQVIHHILPVTERAVVNGVEVPLHLMEI